MSAGYYECPIPEAIYPVDVFADPVQGTSVGKVYGDDEGRWSISTRDGARLLGLCSSERKARERARELEGQQPPVLDGDGQPAVVAFRDVLRHALRRRWIGLDPVDAGTAVDVWRLFLEAEREQRALRLSKDGFDAVIRFLTKPASAERKDPYLSAVYPTVVVSQIQRDLIEPFKSQASWQDGATPKGPAKTQPSASRNAKPSTRGKSKKPKSKRSPRGGRKKKQ